MSDDETTRTNSRDRYRAQLKDFRDRIIQERRGTADRLSIEGVNAQNEQEAPAEQALVIPYSALNGFERKYVKNITIHMGLRIEKQGKGKLSEFVITVPPDIGSYFDLHTDASDASSVMDETEPCGSRNETSEDSGEQDSRGTPERKRKNERKQQSKSGADFRRRKWEEVRELLTTAVWMGVAYFTPVFGYSIRATLQADLVPIHFELDPVVSQSLLEVSGALQSWKDAQIGVEQTDTPPQQTSTHYSQLQPASAFDPRQVVPDEEYAKIVEVQQGLPITAMREEIVDVIRHNQVVVICGATGCGKSTQLPQYIIQSVLPEVSNPTKPAPICIVTQPRRISATSVALRVSRELRVPLGDTVGFRIRLSHKDSAATRCVFVTTGVLLRMLTDDKDLTEVGVVVLDEVHERNLNEDFVVVVLRDLVKRRKDLRVVLMSATIEPDRFKKYFEHDWQDHTVPIINIPGRMFPVEELYLEDILRVVPNATIPAPKATGGQNVGLPPNTQGSFSPSVVKSLANWREQILYGASNSFRRVSKPEYEKTGNTQNISNETTYAGSVGAPALFPPRKVSEWESSLLLDLVEYLKLRMGDAREPQGAILVFLPGWEDISTLVDSLRRSKVMRGDVIVPLHSAVPQEEQAKIFQKPGSGKVKVVVATDVAETSITIDDPPKEASIRSAVDNLKDLGALEETTEEKLTALGKALLEIPVGPAVGKMLIYASILGCLSPALTIASALAFRSPFVLPNLADREQARRSRVELSGGTMSDHLTLLHAFSEWKRCSQEGGEAARKDWSRKSWVSGAVMDMIEKERRKLREAVARVVGVDSVDDDGITDSTSQTDALVPAALLAGSLNVARILYPGAKNRKSTKTPSPKIYTNPTTRAGIHPSSVNFHVPLTLDVGRWMIYSEAGTTVMGGVALKDTTVVGDLEVALFATGAVHLNSVGRRRSGDTILQIGDSDDMVEFRMSSNTAQAVLAARKIVDIILEHRFANPNHGKRDLAEEMEDTMFNGDFSDRDGASGTEDNDDGPILPSKQSARKERNALARNFLDRDSEIVERARLKMIDAIKAAVDGRQSAKKKSIAAIPAIQVDRFGQEVDSNADMEDEIEEDSDSVELPLSKQRVDKYDQPTESNGSVATKSYATSRTYAYRLYDTSMNDLGGSIEDGLPKVRTVLDKHGVLNAGPPLVRYTLVDMPLLTVHVGWPIPPDAAKILQDTTLKIDDLPAGEYATIEWIGPPETLYDANTIMSEWEGRDRFAVTKDEMSGLVTAAARVEHYLNGPEDQPDRTKWKSVVEYLLEN
ncbi:hypothetical protein HDU93_006715 [Gonapodya sp. JEL0774]|nr:hypothetical protein HDU93_006715 [Gonapodya sp. JEL0774]